MKVTLSDIAVRFGAVHALAGVSVTLEPGQVTVLVGPNGAGKSTLLGVLLGLVRADAGELRVNDGTVVVGRGGLPRHLRARLGYLPEAVAFAEGLTGRQVLSFFGHARGVDARAVTHMLEEVGLTLAADRAVRGYSRGMRQRLGLGAALLGEPELLVLDEPTGGLDQAGLALLWRVLAAWSAAGRTVVLTTHDLALIERRAHKMVVLSGGRLVAEGTPDALRHRVQLPVRLRLTPAHEAEAPALAAALAGRGLTPHALGDQLVAEVSGAGLHDALKGVDLDRLRRLRVEEPGLDEVYEALIASAGGR